MTATSTLISERAAAALLDVSVHTLRAWRFQTRGPAYIKMGKAVRYDMTSLEKFIDAHKVVPPALQ
jgi:hypothetical protein